MNSKVSYAVAAILGGVVCAAPRCTRRHNGWKRNRFGCSIQEITVTAQRRSESMQNVPISMQAFTAETLQQLNVTTFDDYIKYLPNVTTANNGPGQNEVFMRGLSAGSQPSQGSASTGLWPNVAIYLDNQSGQLPNRNLDIYAADLNRIEVLEGPQGTLFGAGAEAGVIRYITNEPKLDVTEANVKAGYGVDRPRRSQYRPDGGVESSADRGHPGRARRASTTTVAAATSTTYRRRSLARTPTSAFTMRTIRRWRGRCPDGQPNAGFCVPPGSPSINNNSIAARAINPVTYKGIRVEALYKINDDWDVLITQSYQDMDSQGVFYQQPNASDGAPLRPARSHPVQHLVRQGQVRKHRVDRERQDRRPEGRVHRRLSGAQRRADRRLHELCARRLCRLLPVLRPGAGGNACTPTCFSPSAAWHSNERNTHQQHEFRLSTPDDWRVRGNRRAHSGRPTSCSIRPAGVTRPFRHARRMLRRHPGDPVASRTSVPRPGRPSSIRVSSPAPPLSSGHRARDEADGLLRLRRFRPHSEGADDHGGHASLPVRQLLGRQCHGQLRLLRAGRARGGCLVDGFNLDKAEPSRYASQASRAAPTSPGTSHRT